jgi:hypothetical protein
MANKYDDVLDELTLARGRVNQIKSIKLQEKMEALNRETTAYYDGVYDAIQMILAR